MTVNTYRDITTYPNSDLLDRPAKAVGINLQVRMLDAQLVDLTADQKQIFNRDDRPMMPNVVICMFQLTASPVNTQDLLVTAPKGFVFNENCIDDIEVYSLNLVFRFTFLFSMMTSIIFHLSRKLNVHENQCQMQ